MIPPLVPVALAFLAGILLVWSVSIPLPILLGVGLASGLVSVLSRRRSWRGLLGLLVLWVCLGALRTLTWRHQPTNHVARLVSAEPVSILVHGVVVDDPTEPFTPGEVERQVAVVKAQHVRTQDGWRAATGLVRARLRDPRLWLRFGDEVLLEGR